MGRLGSVAMRECPECRRWIKDTELIRHYRKKHPERMVKLQKKKVRPR